MYDNICKFIAENFPEEFSTWLLGEAVILTSLEPTELSSEPIRADSLLLRQSENLVLHVEFQTRPDPEIPLRMLDYWVRIHRRYPRKQIHQVVIYLKQTESPLVKQNSFQAPNISSKFTIIRLWEEPTDLFLKTVGLLPFAILSATDEPVKVLTKMAARIEEISDTKLKSNLAASSFILAGLLLDKETISKILRKDIMQESVTYQLILEEGLLQGKQEGLLQGKQEGLLQGKQEGLLQGKQEGLLQGKQEVAVNLLKSGMNTKQVAELTGLTLFKVEELNKTKE